MPAKTDIRKAVMSTAAGLSKQLFLSTGSVNTSKRKRLNLVFAANFCAAIRVI